MNLLIVKANDRPADIAISSKMYDVFFNEVSKIEDLNIKTYDVFEEDTPYLGQDLFTGFEKIERHEVPSQDEKRLLDAKQKVMDLFAEADVIAFAFPLWNLTIPAKLQTFIDYIFSAGFTFSYDKEGNMIQLMPDKKIILLNARGGIYSTPETSSMDMAINYMRATFGGVFGMEIIDEVIIEGHNATPDKADQIINKGLEEVKATAQKLANN